jgi:hypothetical protein
VDKKSLLFSDSPGGNAFSFFCILVCAGNKGSEALLMADAKGSVHFLTIHLIF